MKFQMLFTHKYAFNEIDHISTYEIKKMASSAKEIENFEIFCNLLSYSK